MKWKEPEFCGHVMRARVSVLSLTGCVALGETL